MEDLKRDIPFYGCGSSLSCHFWLLNKVAMMVGSKSGLP